MVRTLHLTTGEDAGSMWSRRYRQDRARADASRSTTGATVDGEASTVYAPLVDSPVRY